MSGTGAFARTVMAEADGLARLAGPDAAARSGNLHARLAAPTALVFGRRGVGKSPVCAALSASDPWRHWTFVEISDVGDPVVAAELLLGRRRPAGLLVVVAEDLHVDELSTVRALSDRFGLTPLEVLVVASLDVDDVVPGPSMVALWSARRRRCFDGYRRDVGHAGPWIRDLGGDGAVLLRPVARTWFWAMLAALTTGATELAQALVGVTDADRASRWENLMLDPSAHVVAERRALLRIVEGSVNLPAAWARDVLDTYLDPRSAAWQRAELIARAGLWRTRAGQSAPREAEIAAVVARTMHLRLAGLDTSDHPPARVNPR